MTLNRYGDFVSPSKSACPCFCRDRTEKPAAAGFFASEPSEAKLAARTEKR